MALASPLVGIRWVLTDARAFGLALAMGVLSGGLLVALAIAAVVAATPITDWLTDATGFWYVLAWIGVLVAQLPLVLACHRLGANVITGRLQEALSLHVDSRVHPGRAFPSVHVPVLSKVSAFVFGLPKALALAAVILAVNFIPVAGQVLAVGLAVALSARELAHDLVRLPMERRGLDDAAIERELAAHRVLWYASGSLFTLLSLVPFVNLLAIPAGIAAATSRYGDVEKAVPRLPTETSTLTR